MVDELLSKPLPVVSAVRDRDKSSPRSQHARQLGDSTLDVWDVVQHPGGDGAVERRIVERQLLHVAEHCIDAADARKLDHPFGDVDGTDLGTDLALNAFRELTRPRADFEHTHGLNLGDGPKRHFPGVRAFRIPICLAPAEETPLVCILASDDLRIVVPHGSTIG